MVSTARITIGYIFLLVLYKALIIFILSVIMEVFRSVIMEAFRDQFTTTALLSYNEGLYDEATEEWYAQRDPDEVEREERNCMRLARQFCHLMKEYSERFFTYVLFQTPTRSVAAHLESYLLHVYYTSELDNLHDDKEIDQLELDGITWQRGYALNKSWGDSITSIVKAMQRKLQFLIYMTGVAIRCQFCTRKTSMGTGWIENGQEW